MIEPGGIHRSDCAFNNAVGADRSQPDKFRASLVTAAIPGFYFC